MIGHENVCGQAPTESDDGSTEELKEHLAIAIVDKDRPTFVATRRDVIDRAGEVGTKCSCHAPRLPRMIRYSEDSPRRSENRVGNSSEWKIALRLVESSCGKTKCEGLTPEARLGHTVPAGAAFGIDGHIDNNADGMVDGPNRNNGYGDTETMALSNPMPMATVYRGQVGWHEIKSGQLSFTAPLRAVTSTQQTEIQDNLNAEQLLPAFWKR